MMKLLFLLISLAVVAHESDACENDSLPDKDKYDPKTKSKGSKDIKNILDKCEASSACKKVIEDEFEGQGQILQAGDGLSAMVEMTGNIEKVKVAKGVKLPFKNILGNLAKKVGPFLSALGPIAALIGGFFKSTEEILIENLTKEVKKQFIVVNQNFAKVMTGLTGVKQLMMKLHIEKITYPMISDIKVGQKALTKLIRQKGKFGKKLYKNRLKQLCDNGNIRNQMVKLEMLINDGDAVNGAFIKALMRSENENHHKVQKRLMELYNVLLNGAEVYMFYFNLMVQTGITRKKNNKKWSKKGTYNKDAENIVKCEMQEILVKVLKTFAEIEKKNFGLENLAADLKRKMNGNANDAGVGGMSNTAAANALYTYLSGKYDTRHWVVFVYNTAASDKSDSMGINCVHGRIKMNFPKNRKTVILVRIMPNQAPMDMRRAKSLVYQSKMENKKKNFWGVEEYVIKKGRSSARTHWDYLPWELKHSCPFSFVGYIRNDLHVGAAKHPARPMLKYQSPSEPITLFIV